MLGVVHGAVTLRKQISFTAESWNVCSNYDNKSHSLPINKIISHRFAEYSG